MSLTCAEERMLNKDEIPKQQRRDRHLITDRESIVTPLFSSIHHAIGSQT